MNMQLRQCFARAKSSDWGKVKNASFKKFQSALQSQTFKIWL